MELNLVSYGHYITCPWASQPKHYDNNEQDEKIYPSNINSLNNAQAIIISYIKCIRYVNLNIQFPTGDSLDVDRDAKLVLK